MKIEHDIQYLKTSLLQMCNVVERHITSVGELFEGKIDRHEVYVNDDIVDHYDRLIQTLALDIVIREHPYAKDLRLVTGVLKLVSDLERIGDQAEDMFDLYEHIDPLTRVEVAGFKDMIEETLAMVHNAITSFIKEDIKLAKQVIASDDVVDASYAELVKRITAELKAQTIDPTFAIQLVLVVKYIERIADHAVNIAEWVIYIISGVYKDEQTL